ncbi:MAG: stage III sporulation protein AE [Clostridia bacterium]
MTIFIILSGNFAYADKESEVIDNIQENTDKQIEQLNWKELENFLSTLDNSLINSGVVDAVKKIIKGEMDVQEIDYFQFLIQIFFGKIIDLLPSVLTIVVISLLLGVLVKKDNSFIRGTSEVVYFVCYAVIVIVTLIAVWKLIEHTRRTIQDIKKLSNLALPILLTLISAIGGKVTLSVFQPSVAIFCGTIIEIVTIAILPLAIMSIVFTVISNLSSNIKLEKLAKFFHSSATIILGIVFTVFTAFLTIKGVSAGTIDSVSIRAAKFATKNYVPILGGYLAEGFDLILASSVLIKNAFGIVGLFALLTIITSPIIEIIAYSLSLQLASAVTEPVTDKRVVSFLSSISKSLTVLYLTVLAVAFMLFVVILLLICSVNAFV